MSNMTVKIMLGWCVFSVATNWNRIISGMLTVTEGIDHLNEESTERLLSTYWDYAKRTLADGKLRLPKFSRDESLHSNTGSRTGPELKRRLSPNMEIPDKFSSRSSMMLISTRRIIHAKKTQESRWSRSHSKSN